jgi:hypothetical protein
LKRDIPCLKYELKKFNPTSSGVPAVEGGSGEFALPGDMADLKKSAEEAKNAAEEPKIAAVEVKNAATEAKTAEEEAKNPGEEAKNTEEEVKNPGEEANGAPAEAKNAPGSPLAVLGSASSAIRRSAEQGGRWRTWRGKAVGGEPRQGMAENAGAWPGRRNENNLGKGERHFLSKN